MSEWRVKVNGQKEFEVNSYADSISVNGEAIQADLLPLEEGKFHILLDGRSFNASLVSFDEVEKRLEIKINNHLYSLEVEDQFDRLLHKLGMDNLASTAVTNLKAPMPGLVLNVLVEESQEVEKGDSLLILEAMKMENVLKAPANAKIKKISIEEKQSVEKNQILIEFE